MMRDLFDRFVAEVDDGGFKIYDADAVRAASSRCVDLDESGGLLVVDESESWVSFAVFEFHSGPSTRDGQIVDGVKLSAVFNGCGPSGLRELRHTYWGENGYVPSPRRALISKAFDLLAEWFDVD